MAETSFIIENGRRLNLKDASARKSIGSCDGLQTETKHCLVDAINELNQKIMSGGGGGEKGDPGEDGATYTPSVDNGGNLSWTNDKGLPNPETVNIKGPVGETGPAGAPGKDGSPGADGAPGADATINGVNALTIEAGANIELEQTDDVLTISSTGGGADIPVSDTPPADADFWIDTNEEASDNYATNATAKGYADTAENNAKAYTDEKFSSIPAPDVSGQIAAHNTDTSAHSDIRSAVNNKMATDFSNASAVLSAAKGGTGVTSLEALAEALGVGGGGGGVQFASGSYVGTGSQNWMAPLTVTFDFEPKVFWVHRRMASNGSTFPMLLVFVKEAEGTGSFHWLDSTSSDASVRYLDSGTKITFNGNTVSWYTGNSSAAANESGSTYYYLAIG